MPDSSGFSSFPCTFPKSLRIGITTSVFQFFRIISAFYSGLRFSSPRRPEIRQEGPANPVLAEARTRTRPEIQIIFPQAPERAHKVSPTRRGRPPDLPSIQSPPDLPFSCFFHFSPFYLRVCYAKFPGANRKSFGCGVVCLVHAVRCDRRIGSAIRPAAGPEIGF